ncbi:DUF192 domain-containing protein [Paenibacillus hexagrammi]|uniref:DUF192 domain-containing protein n=1 Tax=Paenibacillus hexagrammi TaxID=2908839 RepID=A0ABY3SHY8_9BACL|nr:DUF192 domain-containing protein [Paenibacillus sp. YPD9-1]UJF32841.1 DUF192 domain-containing protein [Paenibacillus sp. YPD9-1]
MKLVLPESGHVVAEEVWVAATFYRRLKGLMFSSELPEGCCMYIRPCRSVHTFFMNYSIDVVHLDAKHRVVGLEQALAPGKIGTSFPNSESVIEFPAGSIERNALQVGSMVQFES